MTMKETIRYKDAGVDISAAEEAVDRIKTLVRSTFTPSVLTDLGKFGGFYSLDLSIYRSPVLVSSIDGVGTKLKVAFLAEQYSSIGEDLVNHCVNDILVGGAKPLFFLDYIGMGILKPNVIEEIIRGMVRGCRASDCALVGGEMAEMPGLYQKGEFDIAGSIVGVVEKSRIIDGRHIKAGDVLVGLPSNGLHTNGYSLARKVLLEKAKYSIDSYIKDLGLTLGEELLKIHLCYYSVIFPLLDRFEIKGMAHITGGGIVGNTKRILPEGIRLNIDWDAWERPPIFRLIQQIGNVPEEDLKKTMNLGIGLILIVSQKTVDPLIKILSDNGVRATPIGEAVNS